MTAEVTEAESDAEDPEWGEYAEDDAAQAVEKGTCGENLTWTFDSNGGVLTISGQGEMTDY
ncbi:MAG: hypothetical protein Q4B09_11590, partial [Lachnospiraceae bacterium]|nr:hypothetical protein [Lachnospiraceae bacterium]